MRVFFLPALLLRGVLEPAARLQEVEAQLATTTTAAEDQRKAFDELQKTVVALETEKTGLTTKLTALTDSAAQETAALKANSANFEGERNALQSAARASVRPSVNGADH